MGNGGASTCRSKPSRVHVQTDPQAAPMVGQEFRGCGGGGDSGKCQVGKLDRECHKERSGN